MATTAKSIVPDTKAQGQKRRKPLSKAHKAKLAAALANWRASLTDEDRAAQAERMRQAHRDRWDGMTAKEKAAALAGVKAWQAKQRAAKRAAAKALERSTVTCACGIPTRTDTCRGSGSASGVGSPARASSSRT